MRFFIYFFSKKKFLFKFKKNFETQIKNFHKIHPIPMEEDIFEDPRRSISHDIDSPLKNCFFSELNDLSKDVDYYQIHKSNLSADFRIHHHRKIRHNSSYQIQNQKDLIIISKGGMVFNLPLDQQIERIFTISDGLIIEFFIKQEPKFSGLSPKKLKKSLKFSLRYSSHE